MLCVQKLDMDAISEMKMPRMQDLSASLRNLRRPWPNHWPGLPIVFDRVGQELGLGNPRKGSAVHRLLGFGRAVSELVEQDGVKRHAQGQEPAYHNRLHIADTLVCMTYLLKTSGALNVKGARKPAVAAMALSIMAGHDFLHPGGSNMQPGELEERAVQDLQPLMAAAGLTLEERQIVKHCIMATDPAQVNGIHLQIRTRPYDLRQTDCLSVLVIEADITASTLPQTALSLTQSLAIEWASQEPKAAEKLLWPQNRLLFLEHTALFSSPAACRLGLNAVKLRQVRRLEHKLQNADRIR
jgi:hypothetical protein